MSLLPRLHSFSSFDLNWAMRVCSYWNGARKYDLVKISSINSGTIHKVTLEVCMNVQFLAWMMIKLEGDTDSRFGVIHSRVVSMYVWLGQHDKSTKHVIFIHEAFAVLLIVIQLIWLVLGVRPRSFFWLTPQRTWTLEYGWMFERIPEWVLDNKMSFRTDAMMTPYPYTPHVFIWGDFFVF